MIDRSGASARRLTAADYQHFPRVKPDHHYAYGAHPQQVGELYLPHSAAPHPVIVLIHGGCYRAMYDLRPVSRLAKALAAEGFAVWNIEYRRHGNGGSYPQMFLDVAAAADYLRQIAERHALDLGSVISMGHSAGGHLALWLAGRGQIEDRSPLYNASSLKIRGVLALAPLADIGQAVAKGMCGAALPAAMGGDPATAPASYRNASPMALLPLGAPQTLIIGAEDVDILENARSYAEAAAALGDSIELLVLPEAGHFEVVAIDAPAWKDVRRAVQHYGQFLAAKSQLG